MSNEPKITTNNGILVFLHLLGRFFLNYLRHFMVLGQGLSFGDSQVVLTFCSSNLMAFKFTYLQLHKVVY